VSLSKKILLTSFIASLLLIKPGYTLDDKILDPLNLNKSSNDRKKFFSIPAKKAYLTAITADKDIKSVIFTGIPSINIKAKTERNKLIIDIPNTVLHKSISNKNYNWNLKLSNSFPDIYKAAVLQNYGKKSISVVISFEYPISIDLKRINPSKINVNVKRLNSQIINVLANNTETSVFENEKITYNSVNKRANNQNNLNTAKYGSNVPTIDKQAAKLDLPLPMPPVLDDETSLLPEPKEHKQNSNNSTMKTLPGVYERSDNDYKEYPTDLPPVNRPELIENKLLTKADYDDILRVAISLESQGRYEDSIQKYSQAVSVDGERYEAYSALGDVYARLNQIDLSIENYEKSLSVKPDQVKTSVNLSNIYIKQGDNTKALSLLEKIIVSNPSNYDVNYSLANLSFQDKKYDNSLKYYQSCLNLLSKGKNVSELSKIHYNIANTYKAMNSLEKAVKSYRDSIKYYKEFPEAHYNLAATLVSLNRKKEAIIEFEVYIKYASSPKDIEEANKLIEQLR
jgi:tetratricopeptide (TPR) repeat protein